MGRLLNLRTWRRFNDPALGVPRGHLPESLIEAKAQGKRGVRGRGTRAPRTNPVQPRSPWVETSSAASWAGGGGGSPRGGIKLLARGSGRAASAAAAASSPPLPSPPRLRRHCLLPPPGSASFAPSPRGWRRRRARRACAGREVSAAREGKFQVEGRPPAGASSRSPAASWRSRAARLCTSSSLSRRPR